tara:strand:- start:8 stop:244 length:237 start_codon:yes stop_codon:yes gene_type:complete
MTKFILNMGSELEFESDTPEHVVEAWAAQSWSSGPTPEDNPRNLAVAASNWTGNNIRFHTKAALVEDLFRSGILRVAS